MDRIYFSKMASLLAKVPYRLVEEQERMKVYSLGSPPIAIIEKKVTHEAVWGEDGKIYRAIGSAENLDKLEEILNEIPQGK